VSTNEIRAALNKGFPREAIATRKQGGKELSYAEGHYVIRTLNKIFGNASWSYACTTREVYREQIDEGEKGKRWHVTYSSSCELRAGAATIVDVGHGHGIDKSCGQAIESAEKEAATDSLKRAAKSLGDACGLALYDKQQEHVVDEAPASGPIPSVLAVLTAFASTKLEVEHKAAREMMEQVWPHCMEQSDRQKMADASRASFARTSKKA